MTLPTTNAVESVGAEQGRRSEEATPAKEREIERERGREREHVCVGSFGGPINVWFRLD